MVARLSRLVRHCGIGWVALAVIGALLPWQSQSQAQAAISDNAVIAIARRMVCPVCENIPLDECQTRACAEWKEEIRTQLAVGKGEQEIISSFVARFGEQVVGIPQDPLLRALTFALPLAGLGLGLGIAAWTLRRFGRGQKRSGYSAPGTAAGGDYRQRLEEDLRRLR